MCLSLCRKMKKPCKNWKETQCKGAMFYHASKFTCSLHICVSFLARVNFSNKNTLILPNSLAALLKQRTPPAPSIKQQLEHVAAQVEDLVNTQAGIHAKIDLLIRMATL